MKEDFLNVMGHKLPVIAYLRLRETWSSSKRKMKMWQNGQGWIHTTEKHITNGEKWIRQVMHSWKEHRLTMVTVKTQQQYSHKPASACESVHKSTFNIRPNISLCLLKIVLLLYKLTWIRIHHFLNKIPSTPIGALQQRTWFVLVTAKAMTWVGGITYRMDLEFYSIALLFK